MKKSKNTLNKKLLLNKVTMTILNNQQKQRVFGGADTNEPTTQNGIVNGGVIIVTTIKSHVTQQ